MKPRKVALGPQKVKPCWTLAGSLAWMASGSCKVLWGMADNVPAAYLVLAFRSPAALSLCSSLSSKRALNCGWKPGLRKTIRKQKPPFTAAHHLSVTNANESPKMYLLNQTAVLEKKRQFIASARR